MINSLTSPFAIINIYQKDYIEVVKFIYIKYILSSVIYTSSH